MRERVTDLKSLLDRFDKIQLGKSGVARKQPAAHKPLLVLLALGELSRGNETIAFRDLDDRLKALLKTYGP